MKKGLIILFATFCIGCSSSHKKTPLPFLDIKFPAFLEKFDSLELPFRIIGYYGIEKFSDSIWSEKSNPNLIILNPILKPIKDSELIFLKSKYPLSKYYNYYGIFKKRINNLYLIVLSQNNYQIQEHWLKLSLFDLHGNLLDTLTFAGLKVHFYTTYGQISPNLDIKTYSYYNLKEDTADLKNYYATEIKNEYSLSKSGKFVLNKSNRERGYFTTYEGQISRVDTIEGIHRIRFKK